MISVLKVYTFKKATCCTCGFEFQIKFNDIYHSRIMPGGTPHWVLGTSNAICVGRHFYSASTIRSSVNTIVHTSFLRGSATNEDHLVTRSLLYQLLVFWSTRLEKTDVDG
jgi:hypothetical protein